MIGAAPSLRFVLPPEQVAPTPPEGRGLARDEVRLMVSGADGIVDTRFRSLADHLTPADLIVVNTSPTMPAALRATMRGDEVGVHLSTLRDDGSWVVELRAADNTGPILSGVPNEVIHLLPRGSLRLIEPYDGGELGGVRLWRTRLEVPGGVRAFTGLHGRPIRYSYVPGEWPLDAYQTVFADFAAWPGSAEMPSAGRAFSPRVVAALRAKGIQLASIRLDTGVSSQEAGESPYPERFEVSADTAALVNRIGLTGGRVIAVGTTVARALETVANEAGVVREGDGWTNLVLGPDRPSRVVTGLITGFHPPEASHLKLLQAVAGHDLVEASYELALELNYLWHEFGDSCLLLPANRHAEYSVAA